jgi:hypothetical protein
LMKSNTNAITMVINTKVKEALTDSLRVAGWHAWVGSSAL